MSGNSQSPASGKYLDSVKESSRRICQKEGIKIDEAAIERLLGSPAFLESFDRLSSFPGLALPLNFASALDELNVLSILALLNFGSSFETTLRAQMGHGASNAAKALIFSMYIASNSTEGDYLSAKGMAELSHAKVADLMGVDVMVEKPHPQMHGVTVGELGGEMFEFVKSITGVLNETGRKLMGMGYRNLGFLVVEALKGGEREAGSKGVPEAFADLVIEKITGAIPAFRDSAAVDGEGTLLFSPVLSHQFPDSFFRNNRYIYLQQGLVPAQRDIGTVWVDLTTAFPDSLEALQPTTATEEKRESLLETKAQVGSPTGTKGNKGAETSESESPSPRVSGLVVTKDQAYLLRAAAVAAVDAFPRVASQLSSDTDKKTKEVQNVSVGRINSWLAAIAKDRPDYRDLPTLVYRETTAF
ncbi:hypothetical protein CC1G_07387 [Coprinopsis cinerea okayama7|uniref:Uncharacterized protein n=1 Tax=Coprinopsis cinerea (strain Okayama-7 / 130 / ATCC MYA-4618 / FGSC 9003) TaxID=240176 RepID=A8N6L6_COPC7|nr:hypothetical protein CC1G_07387 [Coprinopsis cinerea okayama7\|eukprot:XP_001830472.2 hypothetical protein CC1G_07387 [Coprinopsis cinerea okayama7\